MRISRFYQRYVLRPSPPFSLLSSPQLRAPELSGHRRTSTASPTASSRSQCALPNLNGELQIFPIFSALIEIQRFHNRYILFCSGVKRAIENSALHKASKFEYVQLGKAKPRCRTKTNPPRKHITQLHVCDLLWGDFLLFIALDGCNLMALYLR